MSTSKVIRDFSVGILRGAFIALPIALLTCALCDEETQPPEFDDIEPDDDDDNVTDLTSVLQGEE